MENRAAEAATSRVRKRPFIAQVGAQVAYFVGFSHIWEALGYVRFGSANECQTAVLRAKSRLEAASARRAA